MKKQNKAVGVITAILATLLSIVFVLVTFVTAVFGSVTSIIRPANIVNVVQNIDYTEAIGISANEPLVVGDMEIPVEIVNEFMESPAVEELLSTYTESVSALLTGKEIPEGLTPDKLRQIADKHLDDLLDIVADYLPQDVPRQELRDQVYTMIDENAEEILAQLPTTQQLVEEVVPISAKELATVQMVLGPAVITVLIAVCVVLALLILVCRLRRFGWMLWIGIDSIIVAILVAIVGAGSGIVLSLLQGQMTQATAVASSAVRVVANQLWLATGILLAVGVGAIVVCCIIRSNAKKRLALAAAAEVALAEEAAVQAEEIAAPTEQAEVLEPAEVEAEAQAEPQTEDAVE